MREIESDWENDGRVHERFLKLLSLLLRWWGTDVGRVGEGGHSSERKERAGNCQREEEAGK